MIKVLIVEDSITVGTYMEYLINQESDMQVIGRVANGKRAVEFVNKQKPDIITMDIEMPVMNGLEATRQIMSVMPVPIVIITASRNARETKMTMQALAAGAVTLIEKPGAITTDKGKQDTLNMITTIRLMSEIKVVTRRIKPKKKPVKYIKKLKSDEIKIVAIGVSTGGPAVLKEILPKLKKDFPYPVVIVQHIAKGFINGMIDWLKSSMILEVKIAEEGELLQKGCVYFAPDEKHLIITKSGTTKLVTPHGNGICPSVAMLFGSILEVYGDRSVAVMLTGMGSDGANEMKALYDAGALTIVQSKESALIYGMPAEAVKLGAAKLILNTSEIADFLANLSDKKNQESFS